MSFKDDLFLEYQINSYNCTEFNTLLSELKEQMIYIARMGGPNIHINREHKLSSILKHKKLLINWCIEEGLEYYSTTNDNQFIDITISWV